MYNPMRNNMFIDVDVGTHGVANGLGFQQPLGGLAKLRLSVGWQPYKRLSVFGGPSFNVLIDRMDDSGADTVRPGYGWASTVSEGADERIRLWPGFFGGVRF